MKKRVYIAGPISKGSLAHNVNQATEAFVILAKAGFAPFCPHWSVYSKEALWECQSDNTVCCVGTVLGNTVMTLDDWYGIDLPWVSVADAVLRLRGESTGADLECAHARSLGIPVFDEVAALVAAFHTGIAA